MFIAIRYLKVQSHCDLCEILDERSKLHLLVVRARTRTTDDANNSLHKTLLLIVHDKSRIYHRSQFRKVLGIMAFRLYLPAAHACLARVLSAQHMVLRHCRNMRLKLAFLRIGEENASISHNMIQPIQCTNCTVGCDMVMI